MADALWARFAENCEQVPVDQMAPGDVLLFRMDRGQLHVGVYIGSGEFMQTDKANGLEIIKLYAVQRPIEGVFRCRQQ